MQGHPGLAVRVHEHVLAAGALRLGGRGEPRTICRLRTRPGRRVAHRVSDGVTRRRPVVPRVEEVVAAVVPDHARRLDDPGLPRLVGLHDRLLVADEAEAVGRELLGDDACGGIALPQQVRAAVSGDERARVDRSPVGRTDERTARVVDERPPGLLRDSTRQTLAVRIVRPRRVVEDEPTRSRKHRRRPDAAGRRPRGQLRKRVGQVGSAEQPARGEDRDVIVLVVGRVRVVRAPRTEDERVGEVAAVDGRTLRSKRRAHLPRETARASDRRSPRRFTRWAGRPGPKHDAGARGVLEQRHDDGEGEPHQEPERGYQREGDPDGRARPPLHHLVRPARGIRGRVFRCGV